MAGGTTIKVWDLWIRLFHWTLVVVIGFLLISGETGAGFFDWHRLAGEIALALIVFRITWSLLGSSNASLSGLVVNPRHAIRHLRNLIKRTPEHDRGHNAAGGWAVIIMLGSILVQATTGLFIADDEEWVEGRFHGVMSSEINDLLYNIHQTNADFLQLIVLVHIVMIAVYFLVNRQNLIKPMITGNMLWKASEAPPNMRFGHTAVGLLLAAVVVTVAALLFSWFG